ncbi:MAG: hypothetical protein ACRDNW_20370, partial [Trebonia sp.]
MPAPGTRLTGGLLRQWQRRNATASMPLALRQLVVAGNLDNLRLAIRATEPEASRDQPATAAPRAPRASGVIPPADLGYHGPVFMDSDIYKTLEAIGWQLGSASQHSPAADPANADPAQPAADPAAPATAPDSAADQSREALVAFAAETIELLARVQREDGYLNSYVQASGDPRYGNL